MNEYRLVCGKGIKNVHIWQFLPDFEDTEGKGKWTCIYDVASNGNTLECLAFRSDGREVSSIIHYCIYYVIYVYIYNCIYSMGRLISILFVQYLRYTNIYNI
jgi:hypothetical protein